MPSTEDAQHPFLLAIFHLIGEACIGLGSALPNDAAEVVPPVGFDHCMAVLTGDEAGSQTDDQVAGIQAKVRLLLGHARVDQNRGMEHLYY